MCPAQVKSSPLTHNHHWHLRKYRSETVDGSISSNPTAMIALSFTLACASLLRLQNNAYTGVVVGIGASVPESDGPAIIAGIKEMFREASPILHKATWGMASFGDVTILVPKSWSNRNYGTATFQTFKDAHMRVDVPNPVYGNAPYTQQSGGCGEQGDFIHFTPEYFINNATMASLYGNAGKVLVHEWSHFRYGVFDEYGYPGDRLFPHVYWDEESKSPRPTGCNNSVILGDSNFHTPECQIDSSTGQYSHQCRFRPALTDQPQVTSSLMYMHFLPNVEEFCENHNHNSYAPNKHNSICQGQSVGSIVRKHADFNDVNKAIEPAIPHFHILKSSETKYTIILDTSSGMNSDQRYEFILKALNIFLEELLPEDVGVGLITFDNQIKRRIAVAPLTANWLAYLKSSIPSNPSTDATTWSSTLEAIREGQKQLGKGGSLVLITAGSSKTLTTDDEFSFKMLCTQLKENGTKVMSILYSFSDQSTAFSVILAELAEKTNGKNYYVYEQPPVGYHTYPKVLTQLVATMAQVAGELGEDEDKNLVVIKQETHYGKTISGSFFIDQSVTQNMSLMFVPENIKDVNEERLKVYDPHGNQFDLNLAPVSTLAFMKKVDLFLFNIQNVTTGEWKYEVQMLRYQSNRLSINVIVTSYPSQNEQPIRVRGWTSVGNKAVNATFTPVIIYAEIKQGYRPILNARVTARIQRPRPFNGNVTMETIVLLDNGNGESDITKNDGIYSRYYTNFVNISKGHYLVTIFADDNDGAAELAHMPQYGSAILPINSNIPYCCGSDAGVKDRVPTGKFNRAANAGTFLIVDPPPPGDHTPPGRIGDLHVANFQPQKWQMMLEWTAPGDNFDQGKAYRYEMKYSTSQSVLLNSFEEATSLSGIPDPLPSGSVQRLNVSHSQDFEPMIFYYAMRAIDTDGNKGRISNIVSVQFLSILTPTDGPTSETPSQIPTSEPKPTENTKSAVIGIIVGCVVGVLLIIVILVIIILWHMRRKKARDAANNGTSKTMKPPLFLSPPPKVTENGGKNNVGNGNVNSMEKALSPVQFMSASELLDRHEMQKAQTRSATPSLQGETDSNAPLNTVLPSDNYGIPYTIYGQQHPVHGLYVPAVPYRDTSEKGSISDKHSSSLHSGSSNELRRDNGYFTSFEETSEDSSGLRHAVPSMLPTGPMTSSKTSLARKTVAESQV